MRSILVSLCLFCALSFSASASDADVVDSVDVVAAAAVVDPTPADGGSDSVVFPETDVTPEGDILITPSDVEGGVVVEEEVVESTCDSDTSSCENVVVVADGSAEPPVAPVPVPVASPAPVTAPPVAPSTPSSGTLPLLGAFVAALIAALRRYAHLDALIPPVLLPLVAATLAAATGTVWGVVVTKLPISFTLFANSALGGLIATGFYELLKNFTKKTEDGLPPVTPVTAS